MLFSNDMRTGVDIVSHKWFEEQTKIQEKFIWDHFTQNEWDEYIKLTPEKQLSYACGRYAAKQAVLKALNAFDKMRYDDICILTGPKGQPYIYYTDPVTYALDKLKLGAIEVSIAHSDDFTVANCIIGKTSR